MNCPACGGTAVHVGPASRRTSTVVARCPQCRAQFLVEETTAPTEVVGTEEVSVEYVADWVDAKREGVGPAVWREKLAWLTEEVSDIDKPTLYDVGAGGGEFLAVARDEYGFTVSGNDILAGAIAVARELSGVDLELGDLSEHDHEDDFDVVTMWCVLAHVRDGERMLREVHRMLNPGGLLFLQTPHNTVADRAFYRTKVATGGRVARISDRRLAGHHRILHTKQSITTLLERAGFVDIKVDAHTRYPMSSRAYLVSLRAPSWTIPPTAWVMDKAVDNNAVPRITLDVQARKPR
ncbi:class I SAM-dependent methyltransferase [Nocardioides humilatus]|uniref:Class I SAM-dependent methyltransferase n=1 Tax=Nocardioides humilatus TaxID=2607660 RepID=A0A5B1LP97_9ACTN|nr:class I SAM-dependent methyltransferase [Nocardioides humilatus]KAA1421469.1 class I SAM-dependent methyltransferase [Nocardioides humilatus]